jgi:hypothetical protein
MRLRTRRGYDWTQRFRLMPTPWLICAALLPDRRWASATVVILQPNCMPLICSNSTEKTCAASLSKRKRVLTQLGRTAPVF